jgi:hypothetical protein
MAVHTEARDGKHLLQRLPADLIGAARRIEHAYVDRNHRRGGGCGDGRRGLMRQGAASAGTREEDIRSLLSRLFGVKRWWAGLASACAAYGFQAGLIIRAARPGTAGDRLGDAVRGSISARRRGVPLGLRAWTGVIAVVAGLTVGIGLARPRQGDPQAAQITAWALGRSPSSAPRRSPRPG